MLPLKLTLDRFFSHRYSEIDFEQFNSVLLIGNTEGDYDKSNGCGKSAINESILWCLFGKARVDKSNDVILWGEDDCSVTFEFQHASKIYKIKRSRNRRSSTANVEFWVKDEDDSWVEITGSTSSLTDEKIQQVIKITEKTFTNSVYFRQNDISEFAEAVPSKRKEILKNIVDISRWDAYEKKAKEESKAISSRCQILSTSIENLGSPELTISTSKDKVAEYNQLIEEKEKERDSLDLELEKLVEQHFQIKSTLDTGAFEAVSLRIDNLKLLGQEKKSLYDSIEKDIQTRETSIASYKSQIEELDGVISKLSESLIENVEDKIELQSNQEIYHTTVVNTCSIQLSEILEQSIEEGSCPKCGQDVSEDLCKKFEAELQAKKQDLTNKLESSKKELEQIKKQKRFLKEAQDNAKKVDATQTKIDKLKHSLSIAEEGLSSQKSAKKDLVSELKSLKEKLEEEKKTLELLKNKDFSELETQIEKAKQTRAAILKEIENGKLKVGIELERISKAESELAKQLELKKQLESEQERSAVYEKIVKSLGKQGIQALLLDSLITDLEETSNQILSSICHEPFVISLETTKERVADSSITETLDIKIRKDGVFQHFKSLSGGEQFRISLALRIAMSEIAAQHGGSSLEFLLLDEINSPLDRSGTESLFTNVIKSLENKYKIVVITHNEFLKEKFDHIIDVTKINGESTAIFTSKV